MSVFVQLAAAGLICGMLLTLGGSGGQKELLRLGCACLLVVLLLSEVRGMEWTDFDQHAPESDLQSQVDECLKQAREVLLQETESALGRELERQAAAQGISCTIQVRCKADEEGVVAVETVTVSYQSGKRDCLPALRDSFAMQLATDPRCIIIQEDVSS